MNSNMRCCSNCAHCVFTEENEAIGWWCFSLKNWIAFNGICENFQDVNTTVTQGRQVNHRESYYKLAIALKKNISYSEVGHVEVPMYEDIAPPVYIADKSPYPISEPQPYPVNYGLQSNGITDDIKSKAKNLFGKFFG